MSYFHTETILEKASKDQPDIPDIAQSIRAQVADMSGWSITGGIAQSDTPEALRKLMGRPGLGQKLMDELVAGNRASGEQVHIVRDDFDRPVAIDFQLVPGAGWIGQAPLPYDNIAAPKVSDEQRDAARKIEQQAHKYLIDNRLKLESSSADELKDTATKWLSSRKNRQAIAYVLAEDDLSPTRNVELHMRYGDRGEFLGLSSQLVIEAGPRMVGHQFSKTEWGFVPDADEAGTVLDLKIGQ